MPDVLGETLPLAVGIALSPLPILAVVLLLVSPNSGSAGSAFLAGRLMGVMLVVGLFAVMSDVIERSSGDASPFVAVTRIIVGVALAFLAVGKWSRRPGTEAEPELPGWMSSIEDSTAGRGFRLAFLLSVANPKELLLGVGAGFAVGSAGLPQARRKRINHRERLQRALIRGMDGPVTGLTVPQARPQPGPK